ncbi:MAG TPA: hypothetical protein VM841_03295 [Actinomycetota bacterium]|nr:hypothetical protein [Actinomycetota bacterium]
MKAQSRYVRTTVVGTVAAVAVLALVIAVGAPMLRGDLAEVVAPPTPAKVVQTVDLGEQNADGDIVWDGSNFVVGIGGGRSALAGALIDPDASIPRKIDGLSVHAEAVVADSAGGRSYFFGFAGIKVVEAGTIVATFPGYYASPAFDSSTGRLYALETMTGVGQSSSARLVLINTQTGTVERRSEPVEEQGIFTLVASGGKLVLADRGPRPFRVFDGQTLEETGFAPTNGGPEGGPLDLAVSPSGNRAVVLIDEETPVLRLYDVAKPVAATDITLGVADATGLAYDAKGERLFTVSGENLLVIDAASGKVTQTLPLFRGTIVGASLAYDGVNNRLGVLAKDAGRVLIVKI